MTMLQAFIGCLFALVTFSLAIYTIQLMRRSKDGDPGSAPPDDAFKAMSDLNEKMMEAYKDAEARAEMWRKRNDESHKQCDQAIRQRDCMMLLAYELTWRMPGMAGLDLTYENAVPDEDVLRPMHFAFPSGAIRCGLEEMGNEVMINRPLRITTFRNAVTCTCCRTGLQLDRLLCWRCGQHEPNAEGVDRPHTCDPGPRTRVYAGARPGDVYVGTQTDT